MKNLIKYLSVIMLFLAMGASYAEESPLKFDNQDYFLTYSSLKQDGGYINEYLRKNDKRSEWHKLIGINQMPQANSAKEEAKRFCSVVVELNPKSKCNVSYNMITKSALIEAWLYPNDMSYVEYNLIKYKKVKAGGLISLQYAYRNYNVERNYDSYKPFVLVNRYKWMADINKMKNPIIIEAQITPSEEDL